MKAQSAVEFLLVLAAMLVLFIVLITVYHGQLINTGQSMAKLETWTSAYHLASVINSAYLAGDGAVISFAISAPNSILQVNNSIVTSSIDRYNARTQVFILAQNTTIINITTNATANAPRVVRNKGGTIEIS